MARTPKPKGGSTSASAATATATAFFKPGTAVEVSSEDEGFRGSWFSGSIIRRLASDRFLVEYDNLMADDKSSKHLREVLGLRHLRPLPPPETDHKFKFGDEVDALHNDGWWEGHITQELENERFAVYFRGSKEQLVFPKEQLRLHREWFNHNWVPPLQQPQQQDNGELKKVLLTSNVKSVETVKEEEFRVGTVVEVSSDEDGFSGAWFAAAVVEAKGKDKFVVEYQSLLDDDSQLLKEEIDVLHIRPHPPDASVAGQFRLLDEVDALYNDGWWVGVISKVLADSRYIVYFRSSNEELEFQHSQLRLHQDWIDGKWVMPSKGNHNILYKALPNRIPKIITPSFYGSQLFFQNLKILLGPEVLGITMRAECKAGGFWRPLKEGIKSRS
ncbi:magnesium transporter MRS2-F [Spatholobus suberectus]|nr:magnesium transporter MRS2-F [Spatholobus suberectus]